MEELLKEETIVDFVKKVKDILAEVNSSEEITSEDIENLDD